MNAKVIDGPYAGQILDHNDLNLYCDHFLIGLRKFFAFPPLDRWDDVRNERMTKEESWGGEGLIYELERTPGGLELHLDHDGARVSGAHVQAAGPQPEFPPQTGKHYECVRPTQENLPDGWFQVKDEKDRLWDCKEASGPNPFPTTLLPGGKTVIFLAESLEELRRKLSDVID